MTAPDLAAIRARLAAATEGPWSQRHYPDDVGIKVFSTVPHRRVGVRLIIAGWGHVLRKADADLIAHAPTDLAALCDEVERLTHLLGSHARKAAMSKAWDEGFMKAGRLLLGMDDDAWPPAPNPYEADHA